MIDEKRLVKCIDSLCRAGGIQTYTELRRTLSEIANMPLKKKDYAPAMKEKAWEVFKNANKEADAKARTLKAAIKKQFGVEV